MKKEHEYRILMAMMIFVTLIIVAIAFVKINSIKAMQKENGCWEVTNYADASGNMAIFYTIYNRIDKTLIVVDGGWDVNANQVRDVINKYGGHVDAWFLTHYDNDHVDAFNVVYGDLQGITVDKVYVTPLDYDFYMTTVREWDTPESFEKFLSVTKGQDNVVALNRGEKFEIDGLQVEVFNTYDDTLYEWYQEAGDLPNIASLVFKISAKEDSILFCGDCHGEYMANALLDMFGEDFQATYVQLGHHGNNSFPTEFYDVVNPKVAIFDAPEWLMTGEEYTAAALKQYFDEKGVRTIDYSTAPNTLTLK